MTNFFKTASAAAIALTLAACASTYDNSASDDAMMKNDSMMMDGSMSMEEQSMMKQEIMDDMSAAELTRFKSMSQAKQDSMMMEKMNMMKKDKMMMEDDAMMDDDSMMEKDAMMDKKMMKDAPMVGGAAMYPSKTIVENASEANNLTTLVSLVKQAGLVETLSSPGPFTVFAPTNAAFELVPAETVAALTDPANKDQLTKVLTAHVIAGKVTSADLAAALDGKSSYAATTVSGDTLTFYKMGDDIRVADENGTLATIENADVMQSNGVVHVVNSVLVPK